MALFRDHGTDEVRIKLNDIRVVLREEEAGSPGFTRHDHLYVDEEKWTRTFERCNNGERVEIDKEELPADLYQNENYVVVMNRFLPGSQYPYRQEYCIQYRKYADGTYKTLTIERCRSKRPTPGEMRQITLEEIPRFHGAREMETQRVLLQTCRGTTRCVQKAIRLEDASAPLPTFTQMYVDGKLLCILESSRTTAKHTHEIMLWPVGDERDANGEKIDFYERIKRPRRELWIDGKFSEEIEMPAAYEGIWSHMKEAWDFWQPKKQLTGHEIDKGLGLQGGRMPAMARNYDCFTFTRTARGGMNDETLEARHYDAGTDEGKGVYQLWQSESGSAVSYEGWRHYDHAWYVSTLTEAGWNYYYEGLSEDAKQKFITEQTARKATKLRDGGPSAPWVEHTSSTRRQKLDTLLRQFKNI